MNSNEEFILISRDQWNSKIDSSINKNGSFQI